MILMNNIIWQDLIDGFYYILKKNNHSSKNSNHFIL